MQIGAQSNLVRVALPKLIILLSAAMCSIVATGDAVNAQTKAGEEDLSELPLERLLNMDLVVTLPGRKEQRVASVASAVYVLTSEDIRRSGAEHIAEVLRLVPGVDVARISSNKWAVSIRGFNQQFADKLLVQVDGVSVFSPTTNGVYWDANEIVLADVEKIEVIRGPGGAVWGANAVNGVINIITKNAKDTQGWRLAASAGNSERFGTDIRYGDTISETTAYRVYASMRDRESNDDVTGADARDEWKSYLGGARGDYREGSTKAFAGIDAQSQRDSFYPSTPLLDPPYADTEQLGGSSKWQSLKTYVDIAEQFSDSSEIHGKLNYTRRERESKLVSFTYDTAELDLQHRYRYSPRLDFVYGGSYRFFRNETDDSRGQIVDPRHRSTDLFGAFVQAEIGLIPDELSLTLGSKFERNDLSGRDAMPSAKLSYAVTDATTVWGSVARSIAPPAIYLEDATIPLAAFPTGNASLPTGLLLIEGDRALGAESMISYETGVRTQFSSEMSLDVAAFYSNYSDLFSVEPQSPFVDVVRGFDRPTLNIPLRFANVPEARSYGAEIAFEYKPTSTLSLFAHHSLQNTDVDLQGSGDTGVRDLFEGGSPEHKSVLRALWTPIAWLSVDPTLRYVDHLTYGDVSSYVAFDLHIGFRLGEGREFALVGRNLFNGSHKEAVGSLFAPPPTEIDRSLYATFSMEF